MLKDSIFDIWPLLKIILKLCQQNWQQHKNLFYIPKIWYAFRQDMFSFIYIQGEERRFSDYVAKFGVHNSWIQRQDVVYHQLVKKLDF